MINKLNTKNLNDITQNQLKLLPKDFDWNYYIETNQDLALAGINNEQTAAIHYLLYGQYEYRIISKNQKKQPSYILVDTNEYPDFDPVFYLSEYPDVASYYENAENITQKEKLLHHYINFGKQEGRFKNKYDQDKSFVDIDEKISDIINFQNLKCPTNILECVCLLTTDKEIDGPQYQKFIDRLIANTSKNKITKQIDFKIITNKKFKTNLDLSKLQNIFANVELINLNLSKKDDLYILHLSPDQKLPKYGLKSGPNITFLNTMQKMHTYNTTLLLETDCFLKNNWINDIYNYVKYANGFLVSGALYDGTVFTKAGSPMMNHINGGTAIYATGNPVLQKTIDLLFIFLEKQVQNNMPGLAYDYAFKLMIDNNINNSYNKIEQKKIWQFINRHYLPCKLIINCSTPIDKNIDKNELMIKYNYSILHQKENNE
jgi:hypothetical protein